VAEHVILFAGPMGAGKTTAIRTLSDIEVVATEAANTERDLVDKPTTTVALDYGEILLGDDEKVRLYGIPGQRRFDFMWSILKERARGMVLLVNNDGPDPIGAMLEFVGEFRELYDKGGVVVGISRSDVVNGPTLASYAEAMSGAYPELLVPIFTIDPRDSGHMRMALMTLIASIEARAYIDGTEAA
jgi:signal recognition particle receptor subunit beta